ncbi:MAG: ATP-binding protein [Pseudomonadota bacterium]
MPHPKAEPPAAPPALVPPDQHRDHATAPDAALTRIAEHACAALDDLGQRFHDTLIGSDGEHLVYRDTEEAHRFRDRLRAWPAVMLRAPHDPAYWERRRRLAAQYAHLGLPHAQFFQATAHLTDALIELLFRALGDGALAPGEVQACLRALNGAMSEESAVFNATYHRTREAEKLRGLQDVIVTNLPVTVLCLDAAGVVTAATRPSARLFGERARVGQRYDAFLPPKLVEAADLPSHIGRALATGGEVTLSRVQLGQPPEARYLRLHVVPLDHPLAQVLLHVEELTDTVEAEARAQQAEALARLGALAANVAHEVRNPLAAISLTLQVMHRGFAEDDKRRAILARVDDQVRRLDRLVTDLLDYARPPEPHLRPVDLASLAAEAAQVAAVPASLLVDTPEPALADPQLLQAAVVNLLQNAREAVGEHGLVEIRVGPGAELCVVDDGPGIDPSLRGRLFNPFVTTKARGTGLGLAISRKLVEAQHGTLHLDPAPAVRMHGHGPGARFRIRLPTAPPGGASPGGSAGRSG